MVVKCCGLGGAALLTAKREAPLRLSKDTIPMQVKHTCKCTKQARKVVADFAQILWEMRPVELDTDQLAAVQIKSKQHCSKPLDIASMQ